MSTPKSLQQFAAKIGAFVEPLNFRMHGKSLRGWAIVDADNNELAEIEPVYYSNGDRWKVSTHGQTALRYLKSLRGIDLPIKPGYTGFKFSGMTSGRAGRIITPVR